MKGTFMLTWFLVKRGPQFAESLQLTVTQDTLIAKALIPLIASTTTPTASISHHNTPRDSGLQRQPSEISIPWATP
jgi:hypothetical protein